SGGVSARPPPRLRARSATPRISSSCSRPGTATGRKPSDDAAMRVIDSHTEGEPTRVIVDGGPPLGSGPLAERRRRFADEFDHYRNFAVNEPRGYDAIVGALLCEPQD